VRHRAFPILLALAIPAAAGADLSALQARGSLRVIVAAEEAPETFDPSGAATGFERNLLDSFARLYGLRLEVVPAKSYPDRIPALLAGKGDVVVAIFDTPDRRQQVAFSAEVMPTFSVAVTGPGHKVIASLDELRRLRVGVLKGTAPAADAAAAGVTALAAFDSSEPMLSALRAGTVAAVVMPVSEFAIALKRTAGLAAGVRVGPAGSVAWAVRKEDTALLAALDAHLANVRRSASWNLLLVKYFGEQAPVVLGRRR
jgi:ABC-type amino acid transport substrate-binding protein